jgi:hypothetical protein
MNNSVYESHSSEDDRESFPLTSKFSHLSNRGQKSEISHYKESKEKVKIN